MVASEITNMWVCSECEVMDDIWYVHMPGQPLLLHKPRCPQFLHSACNELISACQVKQVSLPYSSLPLYTSSNPVTTFFIFSINSSISLFNTLHLIRKCFTSSPSPLSHSVHFLSSLFKPLHLPTSTCSSAVPPLALSVFF